MDSRTQLTIHKSTEWFWVSKFYHFNNIFINVHLYLHRVGGGFIVFGVLSLWGFLVGLNMILKINSVVSIHGSQRNNF